MGITGTLFKKNVRLKIVDWTKFFYSYALRNDVSSYISWKIEFILVGWFYAAILSTHYSAKKAREFISMWSILAALIAFIYETIFCSLLISYFIIGNVFILHLILLYRLNMQESCNLYLLNTYYITQ